VLSLPEGTEDNSERPQEEKRHFCITNTWIQKNGKFICGIYCIDFEKFQLARWIFIGRYTGIRNINRKAAL
jgi:hypothetical protein